MSRALIPLAATGMAAITAAGAAAQQLPPWVPSATVVEWRAAPARQSGERSSAPGCFVAEWSLGLAGEILAGGVSGVVTDSPGLPLVAAAVGTVGGMKLGSYAGRCRRFSMVGSLLGAGLSVFLGATAGKAFAEDRRESDDGALAVAFLLMVPLTYLGDVVAAMVSPESH